MWVATKWDFFFFLGGGGGVMFVCFFVCAVLGA